MIVEIYVAVILNISLKNKTFTTNLFNALITDGHSGMSAHPWQQTSVQSYEPISCLDVRHCIDLFSILLSVKY